MSFLKDLENKKGNLRKIEAPKVRKIPDKLLFEDDDDYIKAVRETKFENYYSLIEEFTFKSAIISLTREEIKTLHDARLAFVANKNEISQRNPNHTYINVHF